MKNLRFISFCLLPILSIFNSCGQNNNSKKETTAPVYHDEGVVINGIKWATRNVDKPGTFAAKPEDAGMFYQWNRKVGWNVTDPIINSDGDTTWNSSTPTGDTWEKTNDPCPIGWRIPTRTEAEKLIETDNKWTTRNGIKGRLFSDGTNTLFFPVTGYRGYRDGLFDHSAKEYGYYWTNTSNLSAVALGFRRDSRYTNTVAVQMSGFYKETGFSCRCVAE
jgi:uncharacterized protein (TIGR02145 family)